MDDIILQIYARALKAILQKDAQSEIIYLGRGSRISKRQMTHLKEFRSKQILHQKPWLHDHQSSSSAEEDFADRLSYHLLALKRNRIYGVLRITPYPFNFRRYLTLSSDVLDQKQKYVEFDKFVTLNTDKKLNERIVNMAAVFSVLELNRQGVMIANNLQSENKLLKKGMKDYGVKIQLEDQNYSLMNSSFKDFIPSIFKELVVG
jgi:hypothetical protein